MRLWPWMFALLKLLGNMSLILAGDAPRRTAIGRLARQFYDEQFAVAHSVERLVASEGSAL